MEPDYLNMDPNMLLSLVNTRLRNEFGEVRLLAESMELEHEALVQRLAEQGFCYASEMNQFRPCATSGEYL